MDKQKKFFINQISRLASVYGKDCYPLEVINSIYSVIGHYKPEKLEKAITRVIGDHPNPRYAPGLSKIEAELAKMADEDQAYRREASVLPRGVDGEKASTELGKILKANFGNKGA
ncbi:MAG: hypothetical protein CME63_01435 [Halobacteriovoraceae bacterium]|nr:hypothetical protein [Halobacteriovoraceae bacterium]|tara:strand:+ start:20279 stop:20623 length:345 start_codon:yes stop_codon:yes gene_type:complete